MGIGIRIFLVDGDDKIRRIPASRFERILNGDPKEVLFQYRNFQIRYAEIALELENGRPISILRISYSYLRIDSEGRADKDFIDAEGRAAISTLPSFPLPGEPKNVIHASDRFAQKRYKNEFTWRPSFELEQELIRRSFD
jgi:hypothetical protein